MEYQKLSIHLSYLLRHNPGSIGLQMDSHGWVDAGELIRRVNEAGKHRLTRDLLEQIVANDPKGRYRFSPDGTRIKACQGHSLEWVQPELTVCPPPRYLYHGTTARALSDIRASGFISKMNRHAVHMQQEPEKAWLSAVRRRNQTPVLLQIDAEKMYADGHVFGLSDNGVWCTEQVPVAYICRELWSL